MTRSRQQIRVNLKVQVADCTRKRKKLDRCPEKAGKNTSKCTITTFTGVNGRGSARNGLKTAVSGASL